jgi:hypothetical protein
MKIFVSHSREFDFADELYKPLQQAIFFKNHELILPHATNEFLDTKKLIQQSDLILAEVSFPSTGQGIELGWANDSNLPIICFYKNTRLPSKSLSSVTTIILSYANTENLIKQLSQQIQAI